eukprot:scaffold26045_cov124-Isochrysis_galbana.AAC.1
MPLEQRLALAGIGLPPPVEPFRGIHHHGYCREAAAVGAGQGDAQPPISVPTDHAAEQSDTWRPVSHQWRLRRLGGGVGRRLGLRRGRRRRLKAEHLCRGGLARRCFCDHVFAEDAAEQDVGGGRERGCRAGRRRTKRRRVGADQAATEDAAAHLLHADAA